LAEAIMLPLETEALCHCIHTLEKYNTGQQHLPYQTMMATKAKGWYKTGTQWLKKGGTNLKDLPKKSMVIRHIIQSKAIEEIWKKPKR
jgi:hypothetical protein